jgi:peroxiredoxin
MSLEIGDPGPRHTLPDTDGESHAVGDADGASATVVVFTCNHCPYALAWHERLMDVGRDYAPRGVRFYAVNSNDAERYPRDSYEAMQTRLAEEDWAMPYLHDADQDAARSYGARTTPDVFVFDAAGRLAYRGAPDSDHGDDSQDAQWLRDALDALLAGDEVARPETESVGCSIKWKG